MKSNNKIYSFFIFLALLFWNPISYSLIYANSPIYPSKAIYCFYWIVSLGGALLIVLIQHNMLNKRTNNIVFAMAFTGILFSGLVIIDGVVGSTQEEEQIKKNNGLVFEPNSKATYRTTEYNYVANINSFGLRDREINIDKGDKYRILCFGDSFTFGWGVNVEYSWPKRLEQYLQAHGFENVEVINIGQPGTYPRQYKAIMEKAAPLFKPNLILVGALQLDDLAQYYETDPPLPQKIIQPEGKASILKPFASKLKLSVNEYLKYSFKSILLLAKHRSSKKVEIAPNWQKMSTSMIEKFNYLQRIRFYTLDERVQDLFKSGNLNPGLLMHYIDYPDRTVIFNNPNHPATRFAIQAINLDFKEMKYISNKYNAKLVFINLPNSHYTGHVVIRNPMSYLDSYFETHNNIDPIYHSIADDNDMPYIELTEHFIQLQDKSGYFFKYDGHPNEKGYEEIAKFIGEQLINQDIIRR